MATPERVEELSDAELFEAAVKQASVYEKENVALKQLVADMAVVITVHLTHDVHLTLAERQWADEAQQRVRDFAIHQALRYTAEPPVPDFLREGPVGDIP
jgi:predicted methyltransferase